MSQFHQLQELKDSGFAGLAENFVIKSVTFSDTASGAPAMFTLTGQVIVKIIAVCTVSLTSSGGSNIELGIAGADSATIIAQTLASNIIAKEIWHDASPDKEIEALSVMKEFIITDGNDILLTTSAQMDLGTLDFYCFWTPLDNVGNVVAS